MELKEKYYWDARNAFIAFQSHLYGIESLTAWRKFRIEIGFNRTFMELKVVTVEEINRVQKVSIAPLWN